MIVGIGTDIVATYRFNAWYTYPKKSLQRIFSDSEISYCQENQKQSAARFAARFAAREAFWKALSCYIPVHSLPLLSLCKHIEVSKKEKVPFLVVDWQFIQIITKKLKHKKSIPQVHLSLSHENDYALAFVILEQ